MEIKHKKMKTKIVYDIISSKDDIYFEQVWASAWSLKHFNPNAYVLVLTDKETNDTILSDARNGSLLYIDEIRVVDFDQSYSNKEKSRWIKTNMRELVKGDFLFIDADTIVTSDLSEIDNLTCDIGAVLDYHCHTKEISHYPIFNDMYIAPLKNIYNVDYSDSTDVFNSGVLFVRDNKKTHDFYKLWHKNWKHSRECGECRDQLSLTKTCQELGNPITEISGAYNCQIRFSVQFLHEAKIIHTFASQTNSRISDLFGTTVYRKIKESGYINDEVANTFLECKKAFNSPSILLDKRWILISYTPAFILLNQIVDSAKTQDKKLFKIITFVSRAIMYLRRVF